PDRLPSPPISRCIRRSPRSIVSYAWRTFPGVTWQPAFPHIRHRGGYLSFLPILCNVALATARIIHLGRDNLAQLNGGPAQAAPFANCTLRIPDDSLASEGPPLIRLAGPTLHGWPGRVDCERLPVAIRGAGNPRAAWIPDCSSGRLPLL